MRKDYHGQLGKSTTVLELGARYMLLERAGDFAIRFRWHSQNPIAVFPKWHNLEREQQRAKEVFEYAEINW